MMSEFGLKSPDGLLLETEFRVLIVMRNSVNKSESRPGMTSGGITKLNCRGKNKKRNCVKLCHLVNRLTPASIVKHPTGPAHSTRILKYFLVKVSSNVAVPMS